MKPITFSRVNFSEATAERLVRTGCRRHSGAAVEEAGALVKHAYAQLRLREPREDSFGQFARIAQAYPSAMAIIVDAHLHGVARDEDCADFYAEGA
ncbi:MAG: hypothetical protein IT530_08760 [Burkholderiales bacterium]|nr:hypothetical protein [Burkholderiales bacterium]